MPKKKKYKMGLGTINIIGGIGADMLAEVSLRSVIEQVQAAGDVESYLVNINSSGGEVTEGFAIHNYLTSLGKPVHTRGIGMVASIATVIFLAGSKRELYANTQFLIHNPWTFGEGDADALSKRAEELRIVEDNLIDFYYQKTGSDKLMLQELMSENKFIAAHQAHELKFATDVLDSVQAYAKATKQTNTETTMKKIGKIFTDAFAALRQQGVIMNESVQTMDGKELEVEMAGDSIAIGDTVTMEGEPADGEFELSDGTKIKVVSGTVTEVHPASAQASIMDATKADLQKQVEDLTNQLAAATSQLETLQAEKAQMVEEVEVITNHLRAMRVDVKVPKASASFNRPTSTPVKAEQTVDEIKARMKELQAKSKKRVTIAI